MTALPTVGPAADRSTDTVPALLAEVARRTPCAPAPITPNRTLTHRDLDDHTARLVDVLRRHGIGYDPLSTLPESGWRW
ncbi:hypothetical protein [Streptomyces sp. NPDC056669]|uniref:hypothetical protein n=1 Tax=unclassified Streptomyces TaxID=2593676 RepID=UPI0036B2EAF9